MRIDEVEQKIIDIKKELEKIKAEFSNTLWPKRYISDEDYRYYNLELSRLNRERKTLIKEHKLPYERMHKNKFENFNSLPQRAKELLKEHDYDIAADKENILNFYHSADTVLAQTVMEIRLGHI